MRSSLSLKRVISSSEANGSSIRSSGGSVTSPRAIDTRIFIPPESSRGKASRKPERPTCSSAAATRFSRASCGTPASSSGSATLCATVLHGIRVGSWNTKPTSSPLRRAPGVSPLQEIEPRDGAPRPAISRSAVDLPQPDGPSRETNSPRAIARSRPSSATVPLANCLATPESATRGCSTRGCLELARAGGIDGRAVYRLRWPVHCRLAALTGQPSNHGL